MGSNRGAKRAALQPLPPARQCQRLMVLVLALVAVCRQVPRRYRTAQYTHEEQVAHLQTAFAQLAAGEDVVIGAPGKNADLSERRIPLVKTTAALQDSETVDIEDCTDKKGVGTCWLFSQDTWSDLLLVKGDEEWLG